MGYEVWGDFRASRLIFGVGELNKTCRSKDRIHPEGVEILLTPVCLTITRLQIIMRPHAPVGAIRIDDED